MAARVALRAILFAVVALAGVSRAWCAEAVIPDRTLTPGVIASTDENEVCATGGATYSQTHRITPPSMKLQVRRRYSVNSCGEIDHLLPLSLGGADVTENLWCQPGPPEPWDFRAKDRLETRIWSMVCREHTMSLADAQAIFLGQDWRVAFCKYVGGRPCQQ